ncbi:hypothetical protein B0H14DRAFT_2596296 [Mycena olivaceomarginata]|nr:hypothetical protein B0H14DRAFT_2596296 [Mycena olivaceomarginata]
MPSSKSSASSSIRSVASVAARKLKGAAKEIAKTAVSAVKGTYRFRTTPTLLTPILAVVHAKSQTSRKNDNGDTEDVKSRMHSGVYQFFEPPKLDRDDDGREYQFFKCSAPWGCKHKGKGTTRFQTNKNGSKVTDKSSTSNLVKHAKKCWGADVVEARMKGCRGAGKGCDHPVQPSDRMLTEAELRAHIVRWVIENHRPLNFVEDREFRLIFSAGRPEFRLPGRCAVSRDLNAAYGRARAHIEALLTVGYNGRLSFSTDTWTSPNHRAFVAWIVHLQHEGELLAFPLDIYMKCQRYLRPQIGIVRSF